MELLWLILLVLGTLAVLANVLSLVQGLRLRGHVRRGMRMSFGAYLPRVAVLLPVRGLDEGFDGNVRAILSQAYPRYRLVVIADEERDPATDRIRDLAREFPRVPLEILVSEPAGMGGKVNALRTALGRLRPEDEAVAFADADILPGPDWLRQLVQPLADVTIGASTGFRWYVPPSPAFWALVRAEWNAVSANVLFDPRRNYTWGGSSAVRRENLATLHLEDRWRAVLSDDLVLTAAVRDAGLRIRYAPAALVPTLESASRASCREWCERQMMMASLYLPVVRRYAATAFAIFNGSVLLGLLALVLAPFLSWSYLVPAALFLATLPTTVLKASLRRRAFFSASPFVAGLWRAGVGPTAIAALAVPWLMMSGLLRTRRRTTVTWRDRTYDVSDPHRVRLMGSGPFPADAPGTSRVR